MIERDCRLGESRQLSVGVWVPPSPPLIPSWGGPFQGVPGPRPSQETLLLIVPHFQVKLAPGGQLGKLAALRQAGESQRLP